MWSVNAWNEGLIIVWFLAMVSTLYLFSRGGPDDGDMA